MSNLVRLVLKDGTTIDRSEGLEVAGKLSYQFTPDYLWIHNSGRGDPWSSPGSAEPVYSQALYILCPGKKPQIADFTGMRHLGNDLWKIYDLSTAKMAHPKALTRPEYADSLNYHMLDGGESIFIRLVPKDDIWFVPPIQNLTKAREVLSLNEDRLIRWPWLQHITDHLFNPDYTSNVLGQRSHTEMMNPVIYANRTGTADLPSDYASIWMFGTREPGTNVRLEYYDMSLGYFLNFLRTNNTKSLALFLNLVEQKIARGFYDNSDAAYKYRYCWNGEHYRGGTMVPFDPIKDWDCDVIIAHLLWPDNALITNCFTKRADYVCGRSNVWNGSGGARLLGRYLSNLWDFWKATGDIRFANRASSEVQHALSSVVGSSLYFRESDPSQCSGGEGTLALSSVCKWVFSQPNLQGYQQKLKDMVAQHLTFAGTWLTPTTYKACYYYHPGQSSGVQWSGEQQALSWTQLEPFLLPGQLGLLRAAEQYMYSYYPVNMGVDYGALYPSTIKWIGFAIESMRN